MTDQGTSDFYVVFTMIFLRTWIKTIVNKSAISNHTGLKLRVHALRSYLKLICEYELYSSYSQVFFLFKDVEKKNGANI